MKSEVTFEEQQVANGSLIPIERQDLLVRKLIDNSMYIHNNTK